ncbi:ParA family protein [bacterium]|nr:MAG: ParA family protein [bacterium]
MVIIIGNQKGGAGKSTLTMLLANYLSQAKGKDLTLLDMDYQRSILTLYEESKILENEEPYEVLDVELEHFPTIFQLLSKKKNKIILIDLPGKLDDNNLIPVYEGADLVLIPFTYDSMTYHSTIVFSIVMRKVNPKVNFVYVPSRIKTTVKYETKQEVDNEFSKFGMITDFIPERIDFQRVTTFNTPVNLYPTITPIFEEIIKKYINPVIESEGKNE